MDVYRIKFFVWLISTAILIISYFIGLIILNADALVGASLGYIIVPLFIVCNFLLIQFFTKDNPDSLFSKKIVVWGMLSLNLLFSLSIGMTIPIMESQAKDNMASVMLPLLVILNFIIFDRMHYYLKHVNDRGEASDE